MTDPFLQPDYTVGYDVLLGQMMRDLTPETIYEVGIARTFGCKVPQKLLAPYRNRHEL
jgi:hypothetical protein